MKKKITALLCAVFLIGIFGFDQVRDRWLVKPFTEILSLSKQLLLKELSAAPSHTSGWGTLYVLSADGKLYFKNDAGTAIDMTATGTYETMTTATPSAAFTVDWTANHIQQVTITGAALDITFTNPPGPCVLYLIVIQGDGLDTIDWTNEADIKFPGNVDPVLSTGSGDRDAVAFIWDGTRYLGIANYDFE